MIKYPYTDFHEMNLDWMLQTVKDLQGVYDKLPAELQEYVDNWLNEHPEATTTVLDGSITEQKLSDDVKEKLTEWKSNINSVNPIYLGDYIINKQYLPSSHVIVDNILYAFNATEDVTNEGAVKAFNMTTNARETTLDKTIVMGHANSAAYDPETESVYIAPVFRYDSGSRQPDTRIFKYDKTLTTLTVINTNFNGSRAMALSYDPVVKKLYVYCYNHEIYSYDGSTFELVGTVDFASVNVNPFGTITNEFNQDFAVYDGHFIISSPMGNLIAGNITVGDIKIESCGNVNASDRDFRYAIMGELEGMEFHNGHLYALTYVSIANTDYDVFFIEIPTPYTVNNISPYLNTARAVMTCTYVTDNKFCLAPNEIRSLSQLLVMMEKPNTVNIPAGTWTDPVTDTVILNDDIIVNIRGTYSVNRLQLCKGLINLAMYDAGTLVLRAASLPIVCDRSGYLTLGGQVSKISTPNFTTNTVLVYVGYAWSHTTVRNTITSVEGISYKLGSESGSVITSGFYIGTSKVWGP